MNLLRPKTLLAFLFCLAQMLTVFGQGVSLNVQPGFQSVERGQTANYTLNVVPNGGFSQQVFGSILSTDLPAAVMTTFSPSALNYPYTGGINLEVVVPGGTSLGTYFMVLQVQNGPVSALDTVNLEILEESCPWLRHPDFPNDQNFSRNIAIDDLGKVWTAGPPGLKMYDGTTWTLWNSQNSPVPGPLQNILLDPNGNTIWAGSYGGLVGFDGTFWTIYDTATSAIPGNWVNGLALDSSGNFWCSVAGSSTDPRGIVRFDGTTWTHFTAQNSGLQSDDAGVLAVDRQGNVWAATYNAQGAASLSKFDGNTWTVLTTSNSCLPSTNRIHGIAFDLNNHLWASFGNPGPAYPGNGIFRHGGGEWEIWHGKNLQNYNHILKGQNCGVLQQDNGSLLPGSTGGLLFGASDGTIWIPAYSETVGWGEGVIAVVGSNWRVFNTLNSNLFGDAIGGFAQDPEGDIWATVDLDYYSSTPNRQLGEFVCDSLATGFAETIPEDHKLDIHPNPASTKVVLGLDPGALEQGELTLRDIWGRTLLQAPAIREIDVSSFPPGVYLVEVVTPYRAYHGRFIRQ